MNPASVIKVATTLWALERLGPEHRFTTRFAVRGGAIDRKSGVLAGDLLVRGGGDPDFHLENAFLVARALNELGLREVQGGLLIDDSFWIGWEGGSEKRLRDARARTLLMGARLRACKTAPYTTLSISPSAVMSHWDSSNSAWQYRSISGLPVATACLTNNCGLMLPGGGTARAWLRPSCG